jgi:hypothetical protein
MRGVDLTIPRFNPLTGRELVYKREMQQIREHASAASDSLLRAPERSGKTFIFQTLPIVEQIFQQERRRRCLVILSDMLEDSPGYDFERHPPTDQFATHDLERRQREHLLPDLKGVDVFVAGAGAVGGSEEQGAALRRYWSAYFAATGARVCEYARFLVTFSPIDE